VSPSPNLRTKRTQNMRQNVGSSRPFSLRGENIPESFRRSLIGGLYGVGVDIARSEHQKSSHLMGRL